MIRRLVVLAIVVAVFGATALQSAPAWASYGTTNPVSFTRFAGTDRYDTAARIATATFPSAKTVVLASGASFADALSGSYLAGFVGGPTLLTNPTALSPQAKAAFSALHTKNVYLLGGPSAISAAVEQQIDATPSTDASGGNLVATRVAGSDRFQTSEAVDAVPGAGYVGSVNSVKTALVASGLSFPDALAGGALSASSALPIILTDPFTLTPAAQASLSNLGIKHAVILGGTGAVSSNVEMAINAAGVTTERLAGATRTQTAQAIAVYAGTNLGYADPSSCGTPTNGGGATCSFARLEVARGDNPGGGVDALALGPRAGHLKAPIMLSLDQNDPGGPLYVTTQESAYPGNLFSDTSVLTNVDIAGGSGAISSGLQGVLQSVSGALGFAAESSSAGTVAPGGQLTMSSSAGCPTGPNGISPIGILSVIEDAGGHVVQYGGKGIQPASAWSNTLTVSSSLAAGNYSVLSECIVNFPEEPSTAYGYGPLYDAVPLTIS